MHDPETYEKHKSLNERVVDDFCPALLEPLTWGSNEVVLDYGCGTGSTMNKFILPKIVETGSFLHGVDVSEEMIKFAKEKFGHEKVQFHVGNIMEDEEKWPIKGVKFDKVLAILVIHFIKDYKESLTRFFKCTKPGGQFAFLLVRETMGFETFSRLANSPKWGQYLKGMDDMVPVFQHWKAEEVIPKFEKDLKDVGFEVEMMQQKKMTINFNPASNIAAIMSLKKYIQNVPEEMLEDFKVDLEEIIRNLSGIPKEVESSTIEQEFLLGVARRPF